MSLPPQLAESTAAWTRLDQLFTFDVSTTVTSPSSSSSSTSTSSSLSSYASLTSSFTTLHSLHLTSLYLSHLIDDVLSSFITSRLIPLFNSTLAEFIDLQTKLFGESSRPRRFHPTLNGWIIKHITLMVKQTHQQMKHMIERIITIDRIIQSCTGSNEDAVLPQFYRLLTTLFQSNLNRSVISSSESSSSLPPLKRSDLFHELLFKYFRLNFRAFHKSSTDVDASESEPSIDETMEATEREAEVENEKEETEADMEDDAKQYNDQPPEMTLAQFSQTCSLLLSLHFIGSSAFDVVSVSSLSPSPSSQPHTFILPCDSWISPSYFLDFFFILIEKYLRHTCLSVWDTERLTIVTHWMDRRVKPFLEIILMGDSRKGRQANKLVGNSKTRHASFQHWYSRLHFYAMECFGLMRIREEIFDIIKDYPDSMPALKDLARLLSITNQHRLLIDSLANVFRTRLLQPGTNTKSILEQYANTIACCRILDPNSDHSLLAGILDTSCIGSYVRQRPDAVRNVVRSIWGSMETRTQDEETKIDEGDDEDGEVETPKLDDPDASGGLDLLNELETVPDATQFGDDSDGEDIGTTIGASGQSIETDPAESWHPDPVSGSEFAVAAAANTSTRYLRQADVLSLLIDLCGNGERNEELLLLEYKNFMSDRLLSKRSRSRPRPQSFDPSSTSHQSSLPKDPLFDVELEVTHLELMKIRFGDTNTSLIDVEVMIRDIVNSKRIHTQCSDLIPHDSTTSIASNQMRPSGLQRTIAENLHADGKTGTNLPTTLALAPYFTTLILSSEFWPELTDLDDEVSFRMPDTMQALLDAYAKMYHKLKTPRELEWITSAPARKGNAVQIEIETKDGRIELVECEPVHVAILQLFAEPDETETDRTERTTWYLTDIAEALEADDEDILATKIQFWVQRGLLRIVRSTDGDDDDTPVYELVEVKSTSDDGDDDGTGGDAGVVGGVSDKQLRAQDEQIETYVLGSLGNFASLPTDKLHTMMKMISSNVSGFLYTKSETEFKALLTSMQQRGLLVLKDGHSWSKSTTMQKQQ